MKFDNHPGAARHPSFAGGELFGSPSQTPLLRRRGGAQRRGGYQFSQLLRNHSSIRISNFHRPVA